MKYISSVALCVALLLAVQGHTSPSLRAADSASAQQPPSRKNELRKSQIESSRKNFEPVRRMLIKAGVPFEPSILLTQKWRNHLGRQLSTMPEMQKVKRVTRPLKGVYLAHTLYLPAEVRIAGDTVILVRHLVLTNKNTTIRGPHGLHVFPVDTTGVLDDKRSSPGAQAGGISSAPPLMQGGKLTIDVSLDNSPAAASAPPARIETSYLRPSAETPYRILKSSFLLQGGASSLGTPGTDGADGADGGPGADGSLGAQGANGSCQTSSPDGGDGGVSGADGSDGSNGSNGQPGGVGGTPAAINFTVPDGSTMTYFFNAPGGDGGRGGEGGDGGRGGNGARGGNGGNGADCPCAQGGAGNGGQGAFGGNGGRGGHGGTGGKGGNGGPGGQVNVSVPAGFPSGNITSNVAGGAAGNGGAFGMGGIGGNPATGGAGGQAGGNSNCPTDLGTAGGNGVSGQAGATGNNGGNGASGNNGAVGNVSVSEREGCTFQEEETRTYQAGGGVDCALCNDNTDNDCDGDVDLSDYGCIYCWGSPIVIDTEGDGFDLTGVTEGVWFDITAQGYPTLLGWTQGDEAWLALDRNGNGTIDSGAELFGNFTPQPSSPTPNGFIALAEYDKPGNGDILIPALVAGRKS
jgi:hypothetical protein